MVQALCPTATRMATQQNVQAYERPLIASNNKKMTAFELNAAVYQGLQAIFGNEDYMRQVLDLIKKLTKLSKPTNANKAEKI